MLTPATVGPTVGEALTVIAPMHEFVRLYGKPSLAKDLDSVTVLLQRFSPAGMRTFVDEAIAALRKPTTRPKPMPKEDVVQRHLRQLQQTLGNDPAFRVAYDELDHDPEVGALEIADLAKRFTEQTAKSRPAALKKIWARHHKLMSFKAKSESRDGRSAA